MRRKTLFGIIAILTAACAAFYIYNNTRLFKASPNVVIILVDDMDNSLLPLIPKTNQLIGAQGMTAENYFVTTPLCCPSRSSMLRGQYAHNTDILENQPGFSRFFKLQMEKDTLAVWLQGAGYKTALFGKYLNNYPTNAGRNYVPPGWTDWGAFLGNHAEGDYFYNYTMNENGKLVDYADKPEDYSTDVILKKSLGFLNARAADSSPFFLLVSIYPPHGPATPAPRHEALFNDLAFPAPPSFAEEDMSDKPQIIQRLSQTGDDFDLGDATYLFRQRARSLQSADELVEQVIQTLEQNGQLENTYVFFISDNGFHLGEHRIPSGKGTAYEEDIRVPFMVRGPGIQPGRKMAQLITNIDVAPTIAEIAHVKTPDFVDGRSFLPLLQNETLPWRDCFLIELGYQFKEQSSTGGFLTLPADPEKDNILLQVEGGNFRGIRGVDYVYIEYDNGEIEYYDLAKDPYQLENAAGSLNEEERSALHAKLESLINCAADQCRRAEGG